MDAKTHKDPSTTLMLRVRDQHDQKAFAELFERFAPKLKGFLIKRGATPELAEDVIQNAFVKIWKNAHYFDSNRAQFSAWAFQIANNCRIDILRKESRPIPDELAIELQEAPSNDDDYMPDGFEDLHKHIAALDPKQCEALTLSFLHEMTHEEVQAKLGIPMGTVKSRIRLGLEKLRHNMRQHYDA